MPGNLKKKKQVGYSSTSPAFGEQRQADLWEYEASLVYIVSPNPISAL